MTTLAKIEGFKILKFGIQKFTMHSLIAILSRYGPLWANTTKGGAQHAIVMTGASDKDKWDEAIYNDPWPVGEGAYKSMPLEEFNEYISPQLLFYPPNAFN